MSKMKKISKNKLSLYIAAYFLAEAQNGKKGGKEKCQEPISSKTMKAEALLRKGGKG